MNITNTITSIYTQQLVRNVKKSQTLVCINTSTDHIEEYYGMIYTHFAGTACHTTLAGPVTKSFSLPPNTS